MLEFRHVGMSFPSVNGDGEDFRALEAFDLSVSKGEFITLVGPSGCGKSTLLNIAGALLNPTEGRVFYKGKPLTEPSREIGVMFQTPVLLPWRTVKKNILLPAEIQGLRNMDAQVLDVIDKVGLARFAGAYPNQLSGGMQQRVALGRVLAYEPEVLIMDEPFGSLDEFTREDMNLKLVELTHLNGITVLFVTHNIAEAAFLADRVVVMQTGPGRIAEVLPVPFPWPRTISMMHDPEFVDLTFRIREILGAL